jgi:tyrosyl-tRNA synthetase
MSQDFIDIIQSRGFVHQMTDEAGLRELLKAPGQTAYIGFDCTAKSLHVGSLLQIMLLRWWQKCGHRPIVLLGGGTTKIGDPSGKDESRPRLDDAAIAENMASLKQVFAKFIDFSTEAQPHIGNNALMVNNDDWLKDINYVDFLRDYGRHFSVNRMMTMDSVKLRLERDQHLSFLEFNYMILQAYDFVELFKRHNCRIQLGGSDQWGNIINGIELGNKVLAYWHIERRKTGEFLVSYRKGDEILESQSFASIEEAKSFMIKTPQKYNHHQAILSQKGDTFFGITSPLITTSSGAKMGKTASGAVWLNADLCAPYDYWQFWRNTEDGDVIRFLKLFTELPLAQIAEYESWLGSAKINEAKIILATEATALLHGREAAEKAAATAAETFSGSGVSADLPEITAPNATPAVYELLVLAGFAASNGEARKLIQGNGVSINDAKVTDDKARLSSTDFAQGFAKLSKGKKQHVLIKTETH